MLCKNARCQDNQIAYTAKFQLAPSKPHVRCLLKCPAATTSPHSANPVVRWRGSDCASITCRWCCCCCCMPYVTATAAWCPATASAVAASFSEQTQHQRWTCIATEARLQLFTFYVQSPNLTTGHATRCWEPTSPSRWVGEWAEFNYAPPDTVLVVSEAMLAAGRLTDVHNNKQLLWIIESWKVKICVC